MGVQLARSTSPHRWAIDADRFARLGPIAPNAAWIDEADGIAWFDTLDGLIRLDMNRTGSAAAAPPFEVLVRRVVAGHDRVLYAGAGPLTSPELASTTGALRFEFAAPTFVDERATVYQTRLEGLESEWTSWSTETRRDFTMLPPGSYRFQVRARSVSGRVVEASAYALTILPPWYRTWWAYGGYAAARWRAAVRLAAA